MKSKNTGELLELAIRRQNVNISKLSRRIRVSRKTLYNWFKQEQLNVEIIREIGEVINYDFSTELNFEQRKYNVKHVPASTQTTEYWMRKYADLLEAYTALLTGDGAGQSVRRDLPPHIEK